jgi:hypothetical protein
MINKTWNKKLYLPILFFFIFVNAFLVAGKGFLAKWNIDQSVAIGGNLLLFIVTFLSLYFYKRAMTHASTAGFLRNTYSGIMIKLFACMIVVLIYAVSVNGNVNQGALFTCIFLYMVYAFIEMRSLMRGNKEQKNV